MSELKSYVVWDAPTRWFHWINVLCVMALAGFGLVILNADALDIPDKSKIVLKTLHVWIGYAFVLNIGWRIVWAFFGNRYAQWRQMFPGGPGYLRTLRRYVTSFFSGHPEHYLGHNPAGRIGVATLFFLLTVQAVTGLILAGTDIFYPPFGHWVARWIAAPGVDPSTLVPYAPELYDKVGYADLRAAREPVTIVHLYVFYMLAMTIVLHVIAVVVTELRAGGSLISAMFTGRKIISGQPVDIASHGADNAAGQTQAHRPRGDHRDEV